MLRAAFFVCVLSLPAAVVGADGPAASSKEGHELASGRYSSPPTPTVSARRTGRAVVVNYRFRDFPADPLRRPWLLLVSVQSTGTLYTPYTVRHRIHARRGSLRQSIGLGGAPPFTLRVAAIGRTGAWSREVETTLSRRMKRLTPMPRSSPSTLERPQPPNLASPLGSSAATLLSATASPPSREAPASSRSD